MKSFDILNHFLQHKKLHKQIIYRFQYKFNKIKTLAILIKWKNLFRKKKTKENILPKKAHTVSKK